MRHLMSFIQYAYLCLKTSHSQLYFFITIIIFYWRYYSKYYLEYVITLQIKSSLVPISNDSIDLALTLKEKITQTTH